MWPSAYKETQVRGMVAQCVALLPHSKKVVGSSPALCNMSGLVPGPFCVEFACSPRVHLGSPHRTPQQQKEQMLKNSPVPDQDRTGTSTWSSGAALLAAHCSWLSLGEDSRMGLCRDHIPPTSPNCVCVCVCVCV